jgi:hypothetical protein
MTVMETYKGENATVTLHSGEGHLRIDYARTVGERTFTMSEHFHRDEPDAQEQAASAMLDYQGRAGPLKAA